jgi:gamma-glutamylcyclotransferase (GGCT)/AIG2-like uncharacterized protein YtfP
LLLASQTIPLGLSASQWDAVGQMVLAVGAITAGAWAAYTFWKVKRAEAARWMVSLFKDFYRDETMSRARELIEYDFWDVAAPLLEMRVLDRDVALSQVERAQLRDLDLVLNFLEQLLYLEEEGHLLDRDRNVFFEYWFDQLGQPTHSALRRYLRNCGYERCSKSLGLERDELFVAYGSLLSDQGGQDEATVRDRLESMGACHIRGHLYSRGEFPALLPGDDLVEGELFRVRDKSAFRFLDTLEHYDPHQRDSSLYRRRCVRLADPEVDAWVYYWNGQADELERIETGSWAKHLAVS